MYLIQISKLYVECHKKSVAQTLEEGCIRGYRARERMGDD